MGPFSFLTLKKGTTGKQENSQIISKLFILKMSKSGRCVMMERCIVLFLYALNLCKAFRHPSSLYERQFVPGQDSSLDVYQDALYRPVQSSVGALQLQGPDFLHSSRKREDPATADYMKVLSRHRQKFGKRGGLVEDEASCTYCRFGKRGARPLSSTFSKPVAAPADRDVYNQFEKRGENEASCTYCRFGKRSPASAFQNKKNTGHSSEMSDYFKNLYRQHHQTWNFG